MTPGNYSDSYGDTKLPAVTGKPMAARPGKKKKRHVAKPMHTRMAKAMEAKY